MASTGGGKGPAGKSDHKGGPGPLTGARLRRPHSEVSPVLYAGIHRSILAGYLSNAAVQKEKDLYSAARNREVTLWPGSTLQGRSPRWIVLGEIVRTSRLFGRRAARIDPAWLEELAGHLTKRTYYGPAWDRARGEVTAMERLTLFGLEIVHDRRVSYGRIDPEEAHRIFVMSALVEGDVEDQPAFLEHNLALKEKFEGIQEKLRRRDLIIPEFKMAAFYTARIPGVRDIRGLRRLIADRGGDDGFLRMSEEDLLDESLEAGLLDGFPDEIEIAGRKFPAEYKFVPGEESDGTTVSIAVPELPCVPACRLEWGVPGRFPDLVTALLKALPKRYRRLFQPLQEKVDAIVSGMPRRDEETSLVAAVADFAGRNFGLRPPPEAWTEAAAALPKYLKLTVAAVDPETGKVVASGRDIDLLRKKLGAADYSPSKVGSPAWIEAKEKWERTGLSGWTFGDLPESVPLGGTLRAYPGLAVSMDDDTRVDIVLFPVREEASAAHKRAVRRLFQLKFARDLSFMGRYLKVPAEYEAACRPFGGREKLEKAIGEKLFIEVLERDLRTEAEFRAYEADLNRKLFETGHVLLESSLRIVSRAAEITAGLESGGRAGGKGQALSSLNGLKRPAVAPGYQDEIRSELAELAPVDFLSVYDVERLGEVPRYLEALKDRLDRARIDPEKDRAKAEQLAPYLDALERLVDGLAVEERRRTVLLARRGKTEDEAILIAGKVPRAEKRAAIEELRWMIEEFKVSIFAPGTRTAFPVSAVRLARKVREIEAMV